MTQPTDNDLDSSVRRRLWYADGMALLRRAAMPRTRPSHALCEVAWFVSRNWTEPRRSIALAALRGEDIHGLIAPDRSRRNRYNLFAVRLGAAYEKVRLMRANVGVNHSG